MAYDAIKEIERLRDMQKQQAMLNLDKSKQSALGNLQVEESKIKPMYYNKRNEASTQSQLGKQNTAEFLASRGLTNSGSSAQAELNRQNQLQNTLNQYNTQENQMVGDIARRRTQVNTDYENELAKAYNTIEVDTAQKIIAERLRQEEIARQERIRQEDIARQERQAAASRAAAAAKAASTYPKMTTAQKSNAKESYLDAINRAIEAKDYNKVKSMVYDDKDNIINELGESYWKSIENKLWEWQAY